jgi:hypothetical protein
MRYHLVTFLVGALVALGGAALARGEFDQMTQQSFPCAEDEVLAYAPEFGPDRVGCLHVEQIF